MVVLDTLADINHPNLALEVKKIVLAQVCMDQLATLVQATDHKNCLIVYNAPIFDLGIA